VLASAEDRRVTPVLWICGAPTVGKSVTAWELFRSQARAGRRVAYVDIDQLGMLYPESEADPERSRLKQQALMAIRPELARGRDLAIVSGILDPEFAVDGSFHCLLTARPETLRRRILERGWDEADADEIVAEQEALVEAAFADAVIDTTGLTAAAVALAAMSSFADHTSPVEPDPSVLNVSPLTAPLLFVNGPRGAGCSTVAFELARRRWQSSAATGFLDHGQLAFAAAPDRVGDTDVDLGLTNLETMCRFFADNGATSVVANGHLTSAEAIRRIRALGAKVVRLRADEVTLRQHLLARRGPSEARLAGDDLATATDDHREAVLRAALDEQDRLDFINDEDVVVDASGLDVDDVLAEIGAAMQST
jgi:broad-specificity NMP kinase